MMLLEDWPGQSAPHKTNNLGSKTRVQLGRRATTIELCQCLLDLYIIIAPGVEISRIGGSAFFLNAVQP